MTYSLELKKAMLSGQTLNIKRQKSVMAGIIQSAAKIVKDEEGEAVLLVSENTPLVKFIKAFFEKHEGISVTLTHSKGGKSKSRTRLNVRLKEAERVLSALDLSISNGDIDCVIPADIWVSTRRQRDYLIGFFVASGSISDPAKSYHMEFVCKNEKQAEELIWLMDGIGLNARTVSRQHQEIVYIKDSETIADILTVMDATWARLAFENSKIVKQIRNDVNRLVNCDTANMGRVAELAIRQIAAIKLIDAEIGLDKLDEKLKAAALLRLENPDLSIAELASCMEPKIGKSGMNHRLNKLEELAKKLQG